LKRKRKLEMLGALNIPSWEKALKKKEEGGAMSREQEKKRGPSLPSLPEKNFYSGKAKKGKKKKEGKGKN